MKKIIIGILSFIVLAGIVIIGGSMYMSHQRKEQLYKHGFQLYEEQIATYIKENYTGVSKIEFSPIFTEGDNKYTIATANVVPVIYDNHGNKAKLGGKIGERVYARYGLLHGISDLDFDGADEEVIYLSDSASGQEIEVSKDKHLPKKAKVQYDTDIDENIDLFVKNKILKDVIKSEQGSPEIKIVYNTEIKEGDYSQWQP
ncbi:hypothetical protein [Streptococcus oricebi]|uniref:Uncharacterized protein n=1 Tax=Streptococcus oricebi TaxID=1547447 RepID=A0ABS5B163_9STRE|nr:hypothetical protein [Streptococcus oricebi]MBP2622569.1 hypothetical protein [Streptococcus oricebi]